MEKTYTVCTEETIKNSYMKGKNKPAFLASKKLERNGYLTQFLKQ